MAPGETLAIVGESGSGKSLTATSLLGLLPPTASASGTAAFDGRDLLTLDDAEMRALRGNRIAMIFQDPMSSLNPVHTVGTQVAEASRAHRSVSKPAARAEALALFRRVGIADPERRLDAYPHELSGGMRQRVMIAIAVANRPALLIADEPTTALDVTIQAQILDLLADLRRESGMSLIFITHNLGIVSEIADRVVVMYAGHVVEQGPVADVFAAPLHPYTQALLAAVPREDATPDRDPGDRAAAEPVSRRLPLPSALQPGDRGLHAAAGAARGDAGPAGRLHPCDVRAATRGRAMSGASMPWSAHAARR